MINVQSVNNIKNGWLVITCEDAYIKIDDMLINSEGAINCLNYRYLGGRFIYTNELGKECKEFEIIEIWKPKRASAMLNFNSKDRELIWKEEQKYYIKHKWIGYEGYDYINLVEGDSLLVLGLSVETKSFKTKFMEKEIEEIKKMYNTTLEDFEIIPVEEI